MDESFVTPELLCDINKNWRNIQKASFVIYSNVNYISEIYTSKRQLIAEVVDPRPMSML
jgi:hypothetical protein